MAGGSSSSSSSKPVDMTPQAFKNLQSPFANVVASLLGYTPSSTGTATPSSGGSTGQTPQSGWTQGQQQLVQTSGMGGMGQDVGTWTTAPATQGQNGASTGNQPVSYTGGPNFTDPNSVLSGVPTYNGATTAPVTDNEQSLLNQLMGTSGLNNTASSALNTLLGINGTAAPTVSTSSVDPNAVQSGFTADQNNPLLQAYITASQRATMDNLAQTLQNNNSTFTANGQFIQPHGSSAFDRAQALATQSAANAASDIASNIGYQGYELNQQLNQQTQQSNASNVLQALMGNQSTGLTASQANAANALSGQQNQISAATAQGNLTQSDVSSLVQNLQAQALPRLIEQYGLDQGVQMFNNQMNDLLTILQTGAGVTSPVVANQSQSSSSTKPNLL